MIGFLIFLIFSICCFIAAKTSLNDYETPHPGISNEDAEKMRKSAHIFFNIFGVLNLITAILFLGK